MASMSNLSDEIDSLFEHYLGLLHSYTTLKSELVKAQSSLYQHIARANFSAERGHRYGQDSYDDRMQALRICSISSYENEATTNAPIFNVTVASAADKSQLEIGEDKQTGHIQGEDVDATPSEPAESVKDTLSDPAIPDPAAPKQARRKDPIYMFGILTPQALRMAQAQSVRMVEDIIPKILTVDAEMKEVEIKIRRARKKRAKNAALEEKQKENLESRGETELAS